jgi:hypothetical protein
MTLREAAAILDVSEGHVKDLVRDRALRGRYTETTVREKRRVRGTRRFVFRTIRRTLWTVNGRDVRARRRRLAA